MSASRPYLFQSSGTRYAENRWQGSFSSNSFYFQGCKPSDANLNVNLDLEEKLSKEKKEVNRKIKREFESPLLA
jgi:hypothetical protein